jgi:uncharacterized protein (TIGR02246 family)
MNSDEQAIRDVIERWHRATADGDVDAILQLMTSDVRFLVPGKSPMVGRDSFASGLRELLKTHRIESSGDVQEVAIAGDIGYCITHLSVRTQSMQGGDPVVRDGYTLSIFRKQQDGAWQLARDANLLAPGGKS